MKRENSERKRIADLIAKRPTRHHVLSDDVREQAIAYTNRRVAEGASVASIARELMVTTTTILRWLKVVPPLTAKLRAVHVREHETEAGPIATSVLVVTTRDGLRVEGLTLGQIVELVQALG
jgi:hypothetical protein